MTEVSGMVRRGPWQREILWHNSAAFFNPGHDRQPARDTVGGDEEMQIKNGKDFLAGAMFIALGLAFLLVAQKNYQMGTAVRMGPAYFPSVLGGLLAVLGGIVLVRSFVSQISHPLKLFPFRPKVLVAFLIVGGIAFFGQESIIAMGSSGKVVHQILAAIAVILCFGVVGPNSLVICLLAVVLFGYTLKPLGLVLATVLLIMISAWGGNEFKFKEAVISSIILAAFGSAVFIWGLQLPINIWPQLN
jgi:hypothetical protein